MIISRILYIFVISILYTYYLYYHAKRWQVQMNERAIFYQTDAERKFPSLKSAFILTLFSQVFSDNHSNQSTARNLIGLGQLLNFIYLLSSQIKSCMLKLISCHFYPLPRRITGYWAKNCALCLLYVGKQVSVTP